METWRDIPGFEGRYQVSDQGRVRNSRRGNIKKPTPDKDGYLCLVLYIGRAPFYRKIHRLVAETFLPNPSNLSDVNHIDGVKANNTVSNLEWLTHKANGEHAARNGLMARGDRQGIAKLRAHQIPAIRAALSAGDSMRGIAARFGVSTSAIFDIAHGKTWGSA